MYTKSLPEITVVLEGFLIIQVRIDFAVALLGRPELCGTNLCEHIVENLFDLRNRSYVQTHN